MLLKILTWLKTNWKWLLFPVGILLFLIGRLTSRKPPVVVAPELVGAAEEKLKAEEEAKSKALEAEADKKRRLVEIEKEHAEALRKLTDNQKKLVEALKDDPERLNDFLIDVGKSVRRP